MLSAFSYKMDLFNLICVVSQLGLSLSIDKCKVISFSIPRNDILNLYTLNGAQIERVSIITDLGWINYSSTLYVNHHILESVDF